MEVRWHISPKPGGGIRTHSIPTVCDRLIREAIHQVLQNLEVFFFTLELEGCFEMVHGEGFEPPTNSV